MHVASVDPGEPLHVEPIASRQWAPVVPPPSQALLPAHAGDFLLNATVPPHVAPASVVAPQLGQATPQTLLAQAAPEHTQAPLAHWPLAVQAVAAPCFGWHCRPSTQ
jgi:hypothetical protein